MSNITKKDFDDLHNKVDKIAEAQARMEGKLDGIAEQKSKDWQTLGIIGTLAIALWNLITK